MTYCNYSDPFYSFHPFLSVPTYMPQGEIQQLLPLLVSLSSGSHSYETFKSANKKQNNRWVRGRNITGRNTTHRKLVIHNWFAEQSNLALQPMNPLPLTDEGLETALWFICNLRLPLYLLFAYAPSPCLSVFLHTLSMPLFIPTYPSPASYCYTLFPCLSTFLHAISLASLNVNLFD